MKKVSRQSITIILPSVYGNAFELSLIGERETVVDRVFSLFPKKLKPRIVVITSPESEIARYLSKKYKNEFPLTIVPLQKVRSVNKMLGAANIVLSPFRIIETAEGSIVEKMVRALRDSDVVCAYKPETSVTRLKNSDALSVEKGKIIAQARKPKNSFEKYNGLVAAYGFTKDSGIDAAAVLHEAVFKRLKLVDASAVEVSDSVDIDTWTKLNAYLLRQYLLKSGIDPEFLNLKPS